MADRNSLELSLRSLGAWSPTNWELLAVCVMIVEPFRCEPKQWPPHPPKLTLFSLECMAKKRSNLTFQAKKPPPLLILPHLLCAAVFHLPLNLLTAPQSFISSSWCCITPGHLWRCCLNDVQLVSHRLSFQILLDASAIQFGSLPLGTYTAFPRQASQEQAVYEVCVCPSGKIYLSPAESSSTCQAMSNICLWSWPGSSVGWAETPRTSALELQRARWDSSKAHVAEWDTELVKETTVRSAQKHPGCCPQSVNGGQDSSTGGVTAAPWHQEYPTGRGESPSPH